MENLPAEPRDYEMVRQMSKALYEFIKTHPLAQGDKGRESLWCYALANELGQQLRGVPVDRRFEVAQAYVRYVAQIALR